MSFQEDTIDWQCIRDINTWLDSGVSDMYLAQPLAQDWARLSKVAEEYAEALDELPDNATAQDHARLNEVAKNLGKAVQDHIGATGQNPRKGIDLKGYEKMLDELADTAITAILAIQHFTGDASHTKLILVARLTRIYTRMLDALRKADDAI